MHRIFKKLFTLCLALIMLTALAIPAAADAIVEPGGHVSTSPIGRILAAALIIAVVLVTVLLICRFFGKKK